MDLLERLASENAAAAAAAESSSSAAGESSRQRSATGRMAVRNKSAAPVQITAEQLLREAASLQRDDARPPRHRLVDEDEINEYRVRERKQYEDVLRRKRHDISVWMQYATWEAEQGDFRRARSVFERALQVDFENVQLWAKYIETETKNSHIISARNLYDRVVQLLPRIDRFWFNWAHLEETLRNYVGVRQVFDRWLEWEPAEQAWMLYVRFEERCGEIERARRILERLLSVKPCASSFLKYCRFEEEHRVFDRARAGFEKAIEVLPKEQLTSNFYVKFAEFEERRKEKERARLIYQEGLKQLTDVNEAELLMAKYTAFQKRSGSRSEIEDVVCQKRRQIYEDQLIATKSMDFDVWIDLIRLEESANDLPRIRETYERALAKVPVIMEKKYWRKYIYIYLLYAAFEETETEAIDRVREIYKRAIDTVPHKKFSSARLWISYAQFEVRQMNVDAARKVFGHALGVYPNEKIFAAYSEMELRLAEIEKARQVCAKYIEIHPDKTQAWMSLIDLESLLEETERARALFEMAVKNSEALDQPELMWKSYIDMEVNLGEIDNARALYKRVIDRTQHWKVYKSLAVFEAKTAKSIEAARDVFKQGIEVCKERTLDEDRAALLVAWLELETENGDEASISAVKAMLPQKAKRKKILRAEDGSDEWEEVTTVYIFPGEERESRSAKLLEAAKRWKAKQQLAATATTTAVTS